MISKRIQNIAPSETLAVNSKAKELIDKGEKVFNFSVGEPDINPPEILLEKIVEAYNQKKTKYTNQIGEPSAREKIASYINSLNNTTYTKDNIALTSGGKQGLYYVFQAILNPEDEVVVIKPFWVSYEEQIKLAGAKPVFAQSASDLDLDISEVEKAITQNTKAIVINSPSNPTSKIISKEKLTQLVELLQKEQHKHIQIISDDVYQSLAYDGKTPHILDIDPSLVDRTIIIQSFSKTFAMTGLRLGVVAANKQIIDGISLIQGHASGNPTSIIQSATAEIIGKTDEYEKEYLALFKKRRDLVEKELLQIDNIQFTKPEGAFYFFINISKLQNSSIEFAKKLLEEKHVAVVPGVAFGAEGFVRISFAASEEDLLEGIKRFKEFCENL